MNSSDHHELRSLAMRPGRRRMIETLILAGETGVALRELTAAYNDCTPSDVALMKRSASCDLGRLRSQVERLGFKVTASRGHRHQPGVFVLSRPAPKPAPAPADESAVDRISPAERLFGIQIKVSPNGVSVARSAFLEGAGA